MLRNVNYALRTITTYKVLRAYLITNGKEGLQSW